MKLVAFTLSLFLGNGLSIFPITSYADQSNKTAYTPSQKTLFKQDEETVFKQLQAIDAGQLTFGVVTSTKSARCILNKVANAIASTMGVSITLKELPPKRLPSYLERGLIHGDFSRANGYGKTAKFALKVNNPLAKIPFYAYGINVKDNSVTNWKSLEKYKIASPRGYSIHQTFLKNHTVHLVDSSKAAFGFVKAGRADILVADIITATLFIKKNAPNYDDFKIIGSVLDYMEFNTYISPKYPNLVEGYNKAVKEVTDSPNYLNLISKKGC